MQTEQIQTPAPAAIPNPPPVESPQASPAPDPAPAPAANGSIYDGDVEKAAAAAQRVVQSAWPDDWRKRMAGEDPNELKIAERLQDPSVVWKSYRELQKKLSSGEHKRTAPPEDPEQLKAWRAENDIPESEAGYELPLPDGQTLDALDPDTKESIADMLKTAHASNMSKAQTKALAATLIQMGQKQLERTVEKDAGNADTAADTLLSEWGPDFRRNIAANKAFLKQTFGDMSADILQARLPDGRRLCDVVEFSKSINNLARFNGNDVVLDGDTAPTNIETRKAEIEKIMASDMQRYRREKLDVEYAKILDVYEKQGKLG